MLHVRAKPIVDRRPAEAIRRAPGGHRPPVGKHSRARSSRRVLGLGRKTPVGLSRPQAVKMTSSRGAVERVGQVSSGSGISIR